MEQLVFLIVIFVSFSCGVFGAAPFFFLCHYHGPPQDPAQNVGVGFAEIELSVEIDGNPEFYEPGSPYKVSVMSSSDFDGFMMMGLYTLPETLTKSNLPIPGMYPNLALSSVSTPGMGVLCSIVHSHVSQRPRKKVSFLWLAPPTGSGCVQFMATGTLDQQIIFKDTLAFRLCEKGVQQVSSGVFSMTSIHEHGVVFREDFENFSSTENQLWRDSLGVSMSLDCHPGILNNVAQFCNRSERILTTLPLNTTMATIVQFTTVADNCSNGTWDNAQPGFIYFKFGIDQCRNWISIEKIAIPKRTEHKLHLVSLPQSARGSDVCLQWSQEEKADRHNCWSLDNILVTNIADPPKFLQENFDPIDPGNFLLFPGGKITNKCQSDGNALLFHVPRHSGHLIYATTRDFDIAAAELLLDDIVLYQDFDGEHSMGEWILDGGYISQRCGVVNYKKAAVFFGSDVNETEITRNSRLCTPFLNATSAGTLSFYLKYGFSSCNVTASKSISSATIQIYVESFQGNRITLRDIQIAEHADSHRVVIPLLHKVNHPKSRFCWTQIKTETVKDKLRKTGFKSSPEVPWAVDSVSLQPWRPTRILHVLQFRINAGCGHNLLSSDASTNSITVEFSNDHGISWGLLYSSCLPPDCIGPQVPFSSTVTSQDYSRWIRVTYPLPYPTIFIPTRIRFRHVGRTGNAWAIDDVFAGSCPEGCFGHGRCVSSGCICDAGYLGSYCNETLLSTPQTFVETFATNNYLPENSKFQIRGGSLGYECGILNKGKALVFNSFGRRSFTTSELNTLQARFLELTVRLGSHSKFGGCSGPKEAINGIYIHSSCNGGVQWDLLHHVYPSKDREPRHILVVLPNVAKGKFCRFLIWQPSHSGVHRDVWALDDIAINIDLLSSIHLNFSDADKVRDMVAQHTGVIGPFCNLQDTMRIGNRADRMQQMFSSRLIELKSMDIGPSFMLQFELVLHCDGDSGQMKAHSNINLEFSIDHGMTWNLVQKPCLPPSKLCHGLYSQGTVYFASEFKDWKRVTISLPPNTWSESTKFRFIQTLLKNDGSDESWGIDNIYIGPQCPDLCSGHGLCVDGVCLCDKKFYGPRCLPKEKMPNIINGKMTSAKEVRKSGFETTGGKVFTEEEQQKECGILASGGAIYFAEDGVRQLVTPDLHTHDIDMLQFFLQIGRGEDLLVSSFNDSTRLARTTCKNKYAFGIGVLLQFSNDAGNKWYLIKEYAEDQHRKPHLESVLLPKAAQTNCTRIRWWQPIDSVVRDRYSWALDEINFVDRVGVEQSSPSTSFQNVFISNTENHTTISADHESWAFHTTVTLRRYCLSNDQTLVFDGPELHRFAITHEMIVAEGDIIQFQISVGCTDTFSYTSPVRLEYSHDCGMSWRFVEDECYPELSCGIFQEASVYYMGTHGQWTLIVLMISRQIASNKVTFRWSQQSSMNKTKAIGAFALKNVYIGRPCPDWCFGRGVCLSGTCHCDTGYKSPLCTPLRAHPDNLSDKFDSSDVNNPGPLWQVIYGGWLGTGCGPLAMGNTLYFGGNGTREARTVCLDTRRIRNVKFLLRLGWKDEVSTCHVPRERNESLVMQYSITNGLSWQPLLQFDYRTFDVNSEKTVSMSSLPKSYVIDLPSEARTSATNFRWWQPLNKISPTDEEDERAPWALDNVVFAADDSRHPQSFFEDFTAISVEHWYRTVNASVGRYCFGKGNVLYYSKADELQFVETEDFAITDGAFLQFDLAVNCEKHSLVALDTVATLSFAVDLEYSVDGGHSWNLLQDICVPPQLGCLEYQMSSRYVAEVYHGRWTRITTSVSSRAVSSSTRFRWRKTSTSSDNLGWALDNIYLGNDCPWMCSGHGECRNQTCSCDDGFEGPHCVPTVSLPCQFREVFDGNISTSRKRWLEMYGATIESDYCGSVVSGPALVFDGERGMRMIVTRDLDLSNAMYVQFTLKLGCEQMTSNDSGSYSLQSRLHSILLQYSNNGGITWNFLKEIPYVLTKNSARHVVPLQYVGGVRTNCTRLRFWQPQHSQLSELQFDFTFEWALDSVLVSGTLLPPDVLYDTLDNKELGPELSVWLDWPGGHIGSFCDSSGSRVGLVFDDEHGEKASYTKDVHVTADSVVQFEMKVGCEFISSERHPIRLEYSTDLGRTWKLVISIHTDSVLDRNHMSTFDDDLRTSSGPTIFYLNTEAEWERVVIPLDGLGICGTVRFRWFQGFFSSKNDSAVFTWGLDNIYIGPACDYHCHGHGACLNGVMCQCDADRDGSTCEHLLKSNPRHLKENFEINSLVRKSDIVERPTVAMTAVAALRSSFFWRSVSGAEVSTACGTLITGTSLVFNGRGSRYLISQDLNLTLTSAVQFYLRLGCGRESAKWSTTTPIFFHYSINGGIFWVALEELNFGTNRHLTSFVTVELPEEARTQATMLKWSQPSADGTFHAGWAIDQIYIGGDDYGLLTLNDDFGPSHETNWISTPGALMQPVCGRLSNTLSFAEIVRLQISNIPQKYRIHKEGHDDERYAITTEVAVTDLSYIQFELTMGCRERPSCYAIELEYSLDAGKSWRLVQEKCLLSDIGCTNPQEPSIYFSNLYFGYNRVTFMLPHYTSSRGTRFRWIQKPKFQYSETWALGSVYIGQECQNGCSGRGKCELGKCRCDDGWNGDICNIPKSPLSVSLRDEFEPSIEVSSKKWAIVKGGIVSDLCGSIGSGSALHFYGGCIRLLQTTFLDLRTAVDVRFTFVYGCITPIASRHQNVFLQYSFDAGLKWSTLIEIDYKVYQNKSILTIPLPSRVRHLGVLLRWWQLEHGGRAQNDWAIDNVMIGGGISTPTTFVDLLNGSSTLSNFWLYSSNVELVSFCRSNTIVAVGEVVSGAEDALLETSDIQTSSDSVLEFSLASGCDDHNESTYIPPVYVQYSIDRGHSWQLVLTECLPDDTIGACGDRIRSGRVGAVGSASIYDSPRAWTRERIPMFGRLVSDSIRFRWIQFASSSLDNVATSFTNSFKWGLRDVYIGPGCSDLCHGHGSSRTYPICACDDGYEGRYCEIVKKNHRDHLRDSFSKIVLEPHWRILFGGFVSSNDHDVIETNAVILNKCGSRLLETIDLNLQDAKFLHYVVVFRGFVDESVCRGKQSDNLYLQYSVNGGITWHILYEMVHQLYVVLQTDYIVLPLEARTASTRFRWWQSRTNCLKFTTKKYDYDSDASGFWVIDDILIGGSDINPATLNETFEDPHLASFTDKWWFTPGGKVVPGFCDSKWGHVMVWNTSHKAISFKNNLGLTTRELIIGENYILRFKIIVGCTKNDACNTNYVLLEYRTDQNLDKWSLVESSCFPANTLARGSECPHNVYQEGSLFTSQVYGQWTQVIISLPSKTISSTTQFRWHFIRNNNTNIYNGFGIDDVQIGEACVNDCDPISNCVPIKEDNYCKLQAKAMQPNGLFESFDDADPLEKRWHTIFGGDVSLNGCGSLTPLGRKNYLYFGGCGSRQATTHQLDLRHASKLLFVLRIGSSEEQDNCKVNLSASHHENRSVLLQFSVSRGRTWNLIAIHQPRDFLKPRRLIYDIPFDARQPEVQLRWWQPDHSGQNTDQWALDQIEIII